MSFDRMAEELVNQNTPGLGTASTGGRSFESLRSRDSLLRCSRRASAQKPATTTTSTRTARTMTPASRMAPTSSATTRAWITRTRTLPTATNYAYFSEPDVGTYAEERLMHVAFLSEGGSKLIQSEQDAYFARKADQSKGHGGFVKNNDLPVRDQWLGFTGDKRARLRAGALKARTTCKQCGAVGYWSGDYTSAQCRRARAEEAEAKDQIVRERRLQPLDSPPWHDPTGGASTIPSRARAGWSIMPSMRVVPEPSRLEMWCRG